MATKFDAIMARRGEIMRKALGMDYSEFEQSPIAFDYEAHDERARLQPATTSSPSRRRPAWATRRCSSSRTSPTSCAAMSEPGKGARIFVKDEAANLAGAFKDRRASVSIHVAKEKGYEGVIAATSGNYGAAVASQAARNGLKCIICQETFDSRHVGQPEIVEKGRICEALRRRGRAADRRPGALLPHGRAARRDRLLRRLALQLVRRERHRDPRPRDRPRDGGAHRRVADARRGHPRRRRQHHRHGPRPQAGRRHRHADHQRLRRPQRPAHGQRRRLQPQELHHRPHRLRRAVRHLAGPRRRAAQRGPAAALHRPLPHGHAGRGVLHHRGDGQARGPRARPGGQHRHDRGGEPRPRPAARRHRRRAGDRVHRRRQAPLGQLNFAKEMGVEVRARRPHGERPRQGHRHPRAPRADPRQGLRRGAHAQELRPQRAQERARGLRADVRRHRVPGRRHQRPTPDDGRRRRWPSSRRPEMAREDTYLQIRGHLAELTRRGARGALLGARPAGRRPAWSSWRARTPRRASSARC